MVPPEAFDTRKGNGHHKIAKDANENNGLKYAWCGVG